MLKPSLQAPNQIKKVVKTDGEKREEKRSEKTGKRKKPERRKEWTPT